MSRQTPEMRESADSRHPKIREKLEQLPIKKNVYLCKEVKSPGPEHELSSKETRVGHSTCRDHSSRSGSFKGELCAGMRCGEAHSPPKARQHTRKPRPHSSLHIARWRTTLHVKHQLPPQVNRAQLWGKRSGAVFCGPSLRGHVPPKDQAPERQALKDPYLSCKGRKDLTCTAGTT